MTTSTPRLDQARQEMLAKTPKCQEIAQTRSEVLNSGLAANLEMPHPIFIESGEGGHVIDADGNRYIDTTVGFSLHILGHQHPAIKQALHERIDKGWHFGIHTTEQMPLAQLLHDAIPCAERVIFCNSGTEATMYAMRVARAFTGKEKVGLFEGFYHGAHDYGMVQANPTGPRDRPTKFRMGAGIPDAIEDLTVILPYRDATAFDMIREHKDELAMVAVEGVQSSNPQSEIGPFLQELKAVCTECGVLFMIDEVITGFRLALGGAQEYFGVTPDLATYGKIIGGGIPVGAVAGRQDIMDLFTGLHQKNGVFSGGTFSGNPLTMSAGAAVVGHLKENNPEIYQAMNQAGDRLTMAINKFTQGHNIPAFMKNVGSMFHMYFQDTSVNRSFDISNKYQPAEKAFYLHALNRSVLVPGTYRAFLCAAHTPDIVDEIIQVFQESLLDVQADGLFEG